MAQVAVASITKYFDAFRALNNVTIQFDDGGFFALLGPSGSGKTTLLRIIAGFEFADSGGVTIAGEAVERLPVDKRNVGMMFQNYALFPNMSVYDNVAFGLTVRGISRSETKKRVSETLSLVQLSELEKRKPHQLSGGQKQRVALARAIIIKPRVLLLDEPLSALDKALRMEMQVELKRIQREIGITTIFVTHDQEEALTLSDRVGILRDGELIQQGTPLDIYEKPESVFAATFLGDANVFQGGTSDGIVTLSDGTQLRSSSRQLESQAAFMAVRPEKMIIQTKHQFRESRESREGDANSISGKVTQHIFTGNSITFLVDFNGQMVKVFAQNRGDRVIGIGECVVVSWLPSHSVMLAS
ncbi:MAG: ABC transporter ATP-binding protein [Arenicellales bacterium WSBS_2016_MAG_OTU3]